MGHLYHGYVSHYQRIYSLHIRIHWAMPWAVPIPIGWPSWEPISPSCTMAKPCSRASRMKRLCWGKGSTKSNISKATPDLVDHPLPPEMHLYLYIYIEINVNIYHYIYPYSTRYRYSISNVKWWILKGHSMDIEWIWMDMSVNGYVMSMDWLT